MVNSQPANYQQDYRANIYVTNEIEPIVRTLTAYMCRAKPTVEVTPTDFGNEEQKNVAKIANLVHDAKYDLDKEYQNSKMSAFWALTVGNVYAKDFWNPEKGGYLPDGTRSGDNDVAILTPFSISIDHSITDFDKQNVIVESYLMDTDWAKQAFNQEGEGYTGNASKIRQEQANVSTLNTLEEIKYSIPYMGYQLSTTNNKKTLIQEVYIRPSPEWPKGRFLIRAGGEWVFATSREQGSPYYMPLEDEMWHPYTFFGFEPYMGRALSKSLVEQILSLQMRLNEINGAILENANTIAKPNIMAAVNQLKKGVLNGKGSNVYTYQVIPGAQPPFALAGTPLPAQFFQEKKELIETIVRICGTNFVMSGNAPSGVTAASAIQQLLENATSQQSDLMASWEKYHEQRFTKKLRILHKFMTVPNDKLTNYIKSLNKDLLNQQVSDFVGQTDLSDGITLKIQYGSMIPKSEVAKRDLYEKFADKGLFGNLAEPSPAGSKLRTQLLERLGEKPFDTEESIELKKAKWENDNIKQRLPVAVSPFDNPAIHLPCHIAEIQDPTFLEKAEDDIRTALYDHIIAHQQAEAEKAQAAQMQQMNEMAAAQAIKNPPEVPADNAGMVPA